jgi:polysaccharide export outer membrane protein
MRRVVALVLIGLLTSGCLQRQTPTPVAPAFEAPYTLDSGDRLRIVVFGQGGLSNSYFVDVAGRISFPLIGQVQARGRTPQQLAGDIGGRLRQGFVREPSVSVEIEQYRPFFVTGEVVQSGQFAFVPGITVQSGIAIAGGFTPRAYRTRVEVERIVDGYVVRGTVPLTYQIRPGDTVVVRERWF